MNTPDATSSGSSHRPDATSSAPLRKGRAVIVGGGLAGMLSAAALAGHCDEITVIEQDTLPTGPQPRKCLPQARHGHMLWCGGAEAMERLVPGRDGGLAGPRRAPDTPDVRDWSVCRRRAGSGAGP